MYCTCCTNIGHNIANCRVKKNEEGKGFGGNRNEENTNDVGIDVNIKENEEVVGPKGKPDNQGKGLQGKVSGGKKILDRLEANSSLVEEGVVMGEKPLAIERDVSAGGTITFKSPTSIMPRGKVGDRGGRGKLNNFTFETPRTT